MFTLLARGEHWTRQFQIAQSVASSRGGNAVFSSNLQNTDAGWLPKIITELFDHLSPRTIDKKCKVHSCLCYKTEIFERSRYARDFSVLSSGFSFAIFLLGSAHILVECLFAGVWKRWVLVPLIFIIFASFIVGAGRTGRAWNPDGSRSNR